jgi:GAF domain-containing protein
MGGVTLYVASKNAFINVFSEAPDKLSNYFGSSLEAKDGHIYFLSGGKLININPDGFLKQQIEERVLRLNEVQVNGNRIGNTGGILSGLSFGQNRLYFRFGLLEFTDPEKVKYFYLLEGLDKNWVSLGNHSEITFNSLQPGQYTLRVKATDVYGNAVKEQLSVPFIIHPPFWKTWWFFALVAISIATLLFLLIKWREKNIKDIEAQKLKLQQLNAEQYKSKLELEQIINYFSSSLIDKHTVDDVLWDVAKNLIGRLDFVDCMVYLWNEDKTKMIQKAGFGPKDSVEQINNQSFSVLPGQGVVGYVIKSKEPLVIADTSIDNRYRPDDMVRLSEITVPIIYNKELIGIIDSEHPQKNFYTQQHVQLLTTIATLAGSKIRSLEAEQLLQKKNIEMYSINEQLSKAKLEALRSQMNPHFIFNSLNAIQECILTNKVDAAYEYLSKFSRLQRMVLHNSEKELIPLSSEIEMLRLYLSLESLRFSKSFSYSIDIAGIADTDEIMIPSLITQPFVENAIWHGLQTKEGEKKIQIIYEEKDFVLLIMIDDNGIGREKAAIIKEQKLGSSQFVSKGTVMTQQRLQVLGQQLNAVIGLQIIDKKDLAGNANGTKIIISLPSDLDKG